MLQNLVIGAIGSLIASILFLLSLYQLRPKIAISPEIAKTSYDGKTVYAIKIINSGNRDVVDIRAELLMLEPRVMDGGIGKNILQFSLAREQWFLLHPISKSKDGNEFNNTFEFITADNIHDDWAKHENSYLLFQVHAQDVLSWFSEVFSHEYYSWEDIIEGRFSVGSSMKIST